MRTSYTTLFGYYRHVCASKGLNPTERQAHDAQIAIARARLAASPRGVPAVEDRAGALAPDVPLHAGGAPSKSRFFGVISAGMVCVYTV
jgi:hypothetical protein